MAFIAPALPTATPAPPHTQTTPHAVADGQISVSRRRRVFEFLQQVNTTGPSAAPVSVSTGLGELPLSLSQNSTLTTDELAAARNSARAAVAERLAVQQARIAADSAKKRQEWTALLNSLRTPATTPAATPLSTELDTVADGTKPEIASAIAETQAPVLPTPSPVAASTSKASTKSKLTLIPEIEVLPSQPEIASSTTSSESVAAGVAGLYEPPAAAESSQSSQSSDVVESPNYYSSSGMFRGMVDAAADAVKGATNILENIAEDIGIDGDEEEDKKHEAVETPFGEFVESLRDETAAFPNQGADTLEDVGADILEDVAEKMEYISESGQRAQPAFKVDVDREIAEKTKAPEETGETEGIDKKSLGEKILDAIVEGVPAPGSKDGDSADHAEEAGKAELLELVDSGKLKTLTVTKLRRLLSANSLKTSGRKAELIARLTSFVMSK